MTRWHEAWAEGRTAFHRGEVNDRLTVYRERWLGPDASRVLVPLCGKSHDLLWLRDQEVDVVGIELVEQAVTAFHDENALTPEKTPLGPYTAWRTPGVTILQGDVLAAEPGALGSFDRCWDRAALVALPPDVRPRYVDTQRGLLAPGARVLLSTFFYEQERMDGPPFAVSNAEVSSLWDGAEITLLDQQRTTDDERWSSRGVPWFEVSTWLITV
jgi:thiopurine S-methyltransferase